jgi:chromosome segregation ATPase
VHNGNLASQGAPKEFQVKPVPTGASGTDFKAVAEFQQMTSELGREISSANRKMGEANERLTHLKAALKQTPKAAPELFERMDQLNKRLTELRSELTGDPILRGKDEATAPSISSRVGQVAYGHWDTRQTPTETQQRNIEIATKDFAEFKKGLLTYLNDLESYEAALEAAGAPYTKGRKLK